MARKKLNMITLKNWQECDDALRAIGENTRDIAAIRSVMNEEIAAVKAAAADRARPMEEQITELELALREYALTHRDDMGGLKSRALNFGTVGFRRSTKVSLSSAREKVAAIVARLRARGMTECIRQAAPTVDKEALKKYSAEQIAEIGGTLTVEDEFWYEINEEELR